MVARINTTKGRVILDPPTVDPKSQEAKQVQPGETVRNIRPQKLGITESRNGKLWCCIDAEPVEYQSKYGKEANTTGGKTQTKNVWIGDYRYKWREVVWDPGWQFNIGDWCYHKLLDKICLIKSRHGTQCPWYRFLNGNWAYETELRKLTNTQINELISVRQLYKKKKDSYWYLIKENTQVRNRYREQFNKQKEYVTALQNDYLTLANKFVETRQYIQYNKAIIIFLAYLLCLLALAFVL